MKDKTLEQLDDDELEKLLNWTIYRCNDEPEMHATLVDKAITKIKSMHQASVAEAVKRLKRKPHHSKEPMMNRELSHLEKVYNLALDDLRAELTTNQLGEKK